MQRAETATAIAVCAACFVLAAPVRVAASDPPQPFMLLEVSRDCASEDDDELLVEEIRMRTPRVMIVRGTVDGAEPDFHVRWIPEPDGGCKLAFDSVDNASQMQLEPRADATEIQLAASRIAWLSSVSRTRDEAREDAVTEAGAVLASAVDVDRMDLEVPPETVEPEKPEEPEPPENLEPLEEPEEEEIELPVPEKPGDEAPDEEATDEPPEPVYRDVTYKVSILPGVSQPVPIPGRRDRVGYSFNLVGGSSAVVRNFEAGLLFNHVTEASRGVQLAAGVNVDALNDGVALAGAVNYSDTISGTAIATFANVNAEAGNGVQISGGVNYAGALRGVQIAPITNIVSDRIGGFQLSFVNVAGEVGGAQVGVVNRGTDVNGVQFGLLNVANDVDVPMGLVNVQLGAPFYTSTFVASDGSLVFGVEHGRNLRWAYRVGARNWAADPFVSTGMGLNYHVGLSKTFGWESDGGLYFAFADGRISHLYELKSSLVWRFTPVTSLYAGVHLRVFGSGLQDAQLFVPDYAIDSSAGSYDFFGWGGVHLGVQLGDLLGDAR